MTAPSYDTAAYLTADRFAVFNAAGDSFVSEFAPGLRLRADCGTDGVLLGTVAASSHDAASGRTVVTTTMDGGAALTANLAGVLHGNDLPESLCAHAALHAIGGRDALPGASTGVSGLVSLATTAETRTGAEAAKAVTPAGLAASAKGLISVNTTIYVATTGSDATGTGSSSAPYASIAKALSSIANKLIASGVIVTIQVADGTYTVSSAITIDHPDGDKIQIVGNASAESTAAISSIDSANKAFVVAGDQTDAVGLAVGDRFTVLNGTAANIGIYTVVSKSYSGGNTTITVSESIASSTTGDAVITLKPCNSVALNCSAGVTAFTLRSKLSLINGFHIKGSGGGSAGFSLKPLSYCSIRQNIIVSGFSFGIIAELNAALALYGPAIHGGSYGLNCNTGSKCVLYTAKTIIDGASTKAIQADDGSNVKLSGLFINGGHNPASPFSPALNTYGVNGNAFIAA